MNGTWKDIDKLENDLWAAADNLRASSKLTSNDYVMPVLGSAPRVTSSFRAS